MLSFVLYALITPRLFLGMLWQEYCPHLFARDVIPTEYTAYTLLKENPLPYLVTYVAIPWTWFINNKKMGRGVSQISVENGFTICQHAYYIKILPLCKSMGITTLFTPHATSTTMHDGITIVPLPHFPVQATPPATQKDILYSFVGASNHAVRRAFFAMQHPVDAIVTTINNWYFHLPKEEQKAAEVRYKDILSRSRFAVCLRGLGTGTLRFWEALSAGAIPILVADDHLLLPHVDWDSCVIRVLEKDIHTIPAIILSLSREQEEAMRAAGLKIYASWCAGKNFVQTIRYHFDTLYSSRN